MVDTHIFCYTCLTRYQRCATWSIRLYLTRQQKAAIYHTCRAGCQLLGDDAAREC